MSLKNVAPIWIKLQDLQDLWGLAKFALIDCNIVKSWRDYETFQLWFHQTTGHVTNIKNLLLSAFAKLNLAFIIAFGLMASFLSQGPSSLCQRICLTILYKVQSASSQGLFLLFWG